MIAVVRDVDLISRRIVCGLVADAGVECETVLAGHCDRHRGRRWCRGAIGTGCGTGKFDLIVAKSHSEVLRRT